MMRNSRPIPEVKNISPEIAATIQGAIDGIYKAQQKYGTHNGETNQGPKHISFFLSPILKLMEAALENEHD